MKLFRKILIVVALCIIIPWVTTISFTGVVKREINNIGSDIKRVRVDVGRSVMEVSVEDYIAGVLAARLSYGEEIELLKAEAVMIRSGIYAAMGDEIFIDDDVISMTYLTDKERKKLWGSDYEEKEALVEDCISSVAGAAIQYEESFINCPYTAISAGRTRQGADNAALGYIKSVECPDDLQAQGYLSVFNKSNDDFVKLCNKKFNSASLVTDTGINRSAPLESIQIVSRDASDYVTKVKVGSIVVSGEELADALGLASPCFYFENAKEADGSSCVRITVKGSGSGYGVSIYQAGKLAQSGKNYQEILNYFYNGITITGV